MHTPNIPSGTKLIALSVSAIAALGACTTNTDQEKEPSTTTETTQTKPTTQNNQPTVGLIDPLEIRRYQAVSHEPGGTITTNVDCELNTPGKGQIVQARNGDTAIGYAKSVIGAIELTNNTTGEATSTRLGEILSPENTETIALEMSTTLVHKEGNPVAGKNYRLAIDPKKCIATQVASAFDR